MYFFIFNQQVSPKGGLRQWALEHIGDYWSLCMFCKH